MLFIQEGLLLFTKGIISLCNLANNVATSKPYAHCILSIILDNYFRFRANQDIVGANFLRIADRSLLHASQSAG